MREDSSTAMVDMKLLPHSGKEGISFEKLRSTLLQRRSRWQIENWWVKWVRQYHQWEVIMSFLGTSLHLGQIWSITVEKVNPSRCNLITRRSRAVPPSTPLMICCTLSLHNLHKQEVFYYNECADATASGGSDLFVWVIFYCSFLSLYHEKDASEHRNRLRIMWIRSVARTWHKYSQLSLTRSSTYDDGFVCITTMSCQWCHPAGFRSLFVWQDQEELDMDKIDLPHASIHQCQIAVDECLHSPRSIRCMWSLSQNSSSAVLERLCVQ